MGTPVKLYVYDLSGGLSKALSQSLIGRPIEGIWHTAIIVFEREYFFGSSGIKSCEVDDKYVVWWVRKTYQLSLGIAGILAKLTLSADKSLFAHLQILCHVGGTFLVPHEIVPLGETFVPYSLFKEYLQGLSESTFTGASYDLLNHNCNNFSDEVAQFLCGVRIPKHILDLPDIIRETPVGAALLGLIEAAAANIAPANRRNSREDSPDFLQLNLDIEEARRNSLALKEKRNELKEKLAKKERKRKKKQKKEEKEKQRIREVEKELERNGYQFRNLPPEQESQRYDMAESEDFSQNGESGAEGLDVSEVTKKARDVVAEIEAEERKELESLRNRQKDPPITFKNPVDLKAEFEALVGLIESKLNAEEKQSLEELNQYMLKDEGSWALGDGFLSFVGRLVNDTSFGPEVRTKLINVLACAALKDDVILLLHQDRREHILMNYAGDVEKVSLEEQQALSLFFANLFENLSSSEWLLYISEWQHNNSNLSNIRVTTKVGINSLLSENPVLQDRGSAIVYNMACKEVFDDVAVELTMALLQFLNNKLSEELLFRAMKSLARFCQISGPDVTQLIQMIGPEPSKFKGTSARIDEQIEAISAKLR